MISRPSPSSSSARVRLTYVTAFPRVVEETPRRTIRASFAGYNAESDLDALTAAVAWLL